MAERIGLNSIVSINIPSSIFTNRNLSVLESLVWYLKKDLELGFRDIGKLLNRDERTIWTVHNRAKKKIERLVDK